MDKPFIRNLTFDEIQAWIKSKGHPTYRAKQLYQWFWKKNIHSLQEISNLPKTLICSIEEEFEWDGIRPVTIQQSTDQTIKAAFILNDQSIVEGVIIPSESRSTACISTQVGCPVKCSFCATGTLGYKRNLTTGEIIDQVVWLNQLSLQHLQIRLTNIVIMGMGEPLLNYNNTIRALSILTSPELMNWSSQRITLSTVGIPNAIEQFANESLGIQLALSLHSAIQEKREKLIPLAKKYTLDEIISSVKVYTKKTGLPVTIEYLMLKEVNDGEEDAKQLVKICSQFNSKINLIPYNFVAELPFELSDEKNILNFFNYLKKRNINVRIRKSRGKDIDAACGQLANKIVRK